MLKTIPLIITSILLTISCSGGYPEEYSASVEPGTVYASPGSRGFFAVQIRIPRDSHIYGNPKGPGTGKPTEIKAGPSKILNFEAARFLPAKQYRAPGDTGFVNIYEKHTAVFLPFTVAKNAPAGEYNVPVELEVLLCSSDACIPKDQSLSARVIISGNTPAIAHTEDLLELFRKSRPATGEKGPAPDSTTGTTADKTSFLKDISFNPRYIESSGVAGLLQAIIFGLLAGFILNFMPCVLPVVSLKIMNFVQHAGENRKVLLKLGSVFALGIMTAFTFLAALAAFFGYSWGGLFQHSIFLIIMTTLVFVLAMAMFEVFSLNAPSFAGRAARERSNIYSDAFFKGLLATLLATPCSGPFLGGTLAWALTRSPAVIFIIFMSVGAGMALPYLLLSAFPGLIKKIPGPGEWMRTFEEIMAFLLVFTVIYLLSVFPGELTMPMVTFLAFTAVAFRQYGIYGAIHRKKMQRIISTAALLLIMAGGYFLSFNFFYHSGGTASLPETPFSLERLERNRKNDTVSMIRFTADWCPNCRLVEATSLETEKVTAAVREGGIDFMTADITRPFPEAEALMHSLGSRSIPFLALMPAGKDFERPVCLRDIYSEESVLKAMETASGKKGGEDTPARYLFEIK